VAKFESERCVIEQLDLTVILNGKYFSAKSARGTGHNLG
jgi:hypothetical protein